MCTSGMGKPVLGGSCAIGEGALFNRGCGKPLSYACLAGVCKHIRCATFPDLTFRVAPWGIRHKAFYQAVLSPCCGGASDDLGSPKGSVVRSRLRAGSLPARRAPPCDRIVCFRLSLRRAGGCCALWPAAGFLLRACCCCCCLPSFGAGLGTGAGGGTTGRLR